MKFFSLNFFSRSALATINATIKFPHLQLKQFWILNKVLRNAIIAFEELLEVIFGFLKATLRISRNKRIKYVNFGVEDNLKLKLTYWGLPPLVSTTIWCVKVTRMQLSNLFSQIIFQTTEKFSSKWFFSLTVSVAGCGRKWWQQVFNGHEGSFEWSIFDSFWMNINFKNLSQKSLTTILMSFYFFQNTRLLRKLLLVTK